jgi:hypothetical protein
VLLPEAETAGFELLWLLFLSRFLRSLDRDLFFEEFEDEDVLLCFEGFVSGASGGELMIINADTVDN